MDTEVSFGRWMKMFWNPCWWLYILVHIYKLQIDTFSKRGVYCILRKKVEKVRGDKQNCLGLLTATVYRALKNNLVMGVLCHSLFLLSRTPLRGEEDGGGFPFRVTGGRNVNGFLSDLAQRTAKVPVIWRWANCPLLSWFLSGMSTHYS